MQDTGEGPFLVITEQPQKNGYRSRYASEGDCHGCIVGASATDCKKTYPSVMVMKYQGPVMISVSLVTYEESGHGHQLHVHKLIEKPNGQSKKCEVDIKTEDGDGHQIQVELTGDSPMDVSFPNLVVRKLIKAQIEAELTARIIADQQEEKNRQAGTSREAPAYTAEGGKLAMSEARKWYTEYWKPRLGVVCLKFECCLKDQHGLYSIPLEPVISDPINCNGKNSQLKIRTISQVSGSCRGGEAIILLCDKIAKEDTSQIRVHFFEKSGTGQLIWEDFGDFSKTDVHHQCAIVFRVPAYADTSIENAVQAYVRLTMNGDSSNASNTIQYTYKPSTECTCRNNTKRKRIRPLIPMDTHDPPTTSEGTSKSPKAMRLQTQHTTPNATHSHVPHVSYFPELFSSTGSSDGLNSSYGSTDGADKRCSWGSSTGSTSSVESTTSASVNPFLETNTIIESQNLLDTTSQARSNGNNLLPGNNRACENIFGPNYTTTLNAGNNVQRNSPEHCQLSSPESNTSPPCTVDIQTYGNQVLMENTMCADNLHNYNSALGLSVANTINYLGTTPCVNLQSTVGANYQAVGVSESQFRPGHRRTPSDESSTSSHNTNDNCYGQFNGPESPNGLSPPHTTTERSLYPVSPMYKQSVNNPTEHDLRDINMDISTEVIELLNKFLKDPSSEGLLFEGLVGDVPSTASVSNITASSAVPISIPATTPTGNETVLSSNTTQNNVISHEQFPSLPPEDIALHLNYTQCVPITQPTYHAREFPGNTKRQPDFDDIDGHVLQSPYNPLTLEVVEVTENQVKRSESEAAYEISKQTNVIELTLDDQSVSQVSRTVTPATDDATQLSKITTKNKTFKTARNVSLNTLVGPTNKCKEEAKILHPYNNCAHGCKQSFQNGPVTIDTVKAKTSEQAELAYKPETIELVPKYLENIGTEQSVKPTQTSNVQLPEINDKSSAETVTIDGQLLSTYETKYSDPSSTSKLSKFDDIDGYDISNENSLVGSSNSSKEKISSDESPEAQFIPRSLNSSIRGHLVDALDRLDISDNKQSQPSGTHTSKEIRHQYERVLNENTELKKNILKLSENVTSAIQRYARTNDVRFILQPLKNQLANCNEDGDNSFHLAVIEEKIEALLALCDVLSPAESDVLNSHNSLYQTPLHTAVTINQPDMLEILLESGADMESVDDNGDNVYHISAKMGHSHCIRILSRYITGELVDPLNYEGLSPLHLAVKHGEDLGCMRALVEAGCDVNTQDTCSGYTPLHYAVNRDCLAMVGFLLIDGNANPNIRSQGDISPLQIAAARNQHDISAILLACGAINEETDHTDTESEDGEEEEQYQFYE